MDDFLSAIEGNELTEAIAVLDRLRSHVQSHFKSNKR